MDLPSCSAQRKVKDPPKPRSTRIAWLGWGGAGRCGIVTWRLVDDKCASAPFFGIPSKSFPFPNMLYIYIYITCWFFTIKTYTFSRNYPPQNLQRKTANHTTFPNLLPSPFPTSTPGDAKLSNPGGVTATVPKEPIPQEAVPSPRGEAEGVPGSGDTSPTERRRPVSVMEWTYISRSKKVVSVGGSLGKLKVEDSFVWVLDWKSRV